MNDSLVILLDLSQFAKALGAEVTVISNSSDKAVDAKSFGATEFTLWTDSVVLGQYHNKFDAIVNTVCSDLPWDSLLAMLAPEGTLIQVLATPCALNKNGALLNICFSFLSYSLVHQKIP